MQGVSHGNIKPKNGLTPAQASEYVSGQSPTDLPERINPKKMQRQRQMKKAKSKY